MLLVTVSIGLVATVVAAASPGYWWFVVIFALGRPFLSSTNALSQVSGGRADLDAPTGPRPSPWSPPATAWVRA